MRHISLRNQTCAPVFIADFNQTVSNRFAVKGTCGSNRERHGPGQVEAYDIWYEGTKLWYKANPGCKIAINDFNGLELRGGVLFGTKRFPASPPLL